MLDIQGLSIRFQSRAGLVHAATDVSLGLRKGEVLGLAGESGSGKTTTALAIPGLLPRNASVTGGRILFHGDDLLERSETEMEAIRWKRISVVFQGAMNALNPVQRVGSQILEAIQRHEPDVPEAVGRRRVGELFEKVGISPSRQYDYPHEFSGGMRQRAMIAMALACGPELVIADEPVTALDVMIQAQILSLIMSLRRDLDLSMILISHDLSVIAETCTSIAVMYAGRVVETGPVGAVFSSPAHPYSRALLGAFPRIHGPRGIAAGIPGNPPDLVHPPAGCAFAERCPECLERCGTMVPPTTTVSEGHVAACHLLAGGGRG